MKQLAIAMMMFESKAKHLPPPAVAGNAIKPGIAGNAKCSWRVAILPYLGDIEASETYGQYHFDEPWDSDHNRTLIAKMPAAFRDPHDDPKSTNSSYFMITGDGTVGDNAEGTKFRDIKDGLSQTIILVEAKRETPWTKPEDIEVDLHRVNPKPLPKFGGHWPDGYFGAACCDGHIEVVSPNVDSNVLRTYFSISGGEHGEDLNPPAKKPPASEPAKGRGL